MRDDTPKPRRSRFIETAKELECDEDEERFNDTLKRIVPKKDGARVDAHGAAFLEARDDGLADGTAAGRAAPLLPADIGLVGLDVSPLPQPQQRKRSTQNVLDTDIMPFSPVTVFAKNERANLSRSERTSAVALSKKILAAYGGQP